jgi:hypothetical protein
MSSLTKINVTFSGAHSLSMTLKSKGSSSSGISLYCNKHCWKISQETLLNSVYNDLLPFVVGLSHDSFTLLSVKNVMLFQHCQQAIQALCTGFSQEAL